MMIKSVNITKLFNEYDYNLDICCPLTFLHSPNGMGKSTLMRMVYAALKGDVRYLSDTPFERMEIWFDDDAIMVLQKYDGKLNVLMQKSCTSGSGSQRSTRSLSPIPRTRGTTSPTGSWSSGRRT